MRGVRNIQCGMREYGELSKACGIFLTKQNGALFFIEFFSGQLSSLQKECGAYMTLEREKVKDSLWS